MTKYDIHFADGRDGETSLKPLSRAADEWLNERFAVITYDLTRDQMLAIAAEAYKAGFRVRGAGLAIRRCRNH
jgi:hypothetical protein